MMFVCVARLACQPGEVVSTGLSSENPYDHGFGILSKEGWFDVCGLHLVERDRPPLKSPPGDFRFGVSVRLRAIVHWEERVTFCGTSESCTSGNTSMFVDLTCAFNPAPSTYVYIYIYIYNHPWLSGWEINFTGIPKGVLPSHPLLVHLPGPPSQVPPLVFSP